MMDNAAAIVFGGAIAFVGAVWVGVLAGSSWQLAAAVFFLVLGTMMLSAGVVVSRYRRGLWR